MNVSLTPELEKFVDDTVATGRYTSASEVVRAGLRILEQEEKWKQYAQEKIEIGLQQAREGKFVSQDEVEKLLSKHIRKRA